MNTISSEVELLRIRLEASERIASIGDWESDAEHLYLHWSREVYTILGLPHDGGRPDAEVFYARVHPEDLQYVRRCKQTLAGGLLRMAFDHRIVRPDGEIRHVQQRAEFIPATEERHARIIGTIQDITGLKDAEEKLRGKTAVLEAQLNSSMDGILVVDAYGRKVLQNDRLTELLKIPVSLAEQDDDKPQMEYVMTQVTAPDDFRAKIMHLYAYPNEISRNEIEMTDGTTLDRYSAPVIGKGGQHYGRIWTFRDISDQKTAQAALRASEERFRLVAKTIGDVIWDWNLQSDVIWRSDGFENTFGLVALEADEPQANWSRLIHEEDRVRIAHSQRGAIAGSHPTWTEQYRVLRRDGSYAFVEDRAQIVRDEEGKAVRMIGGVRDLTEMKNFEAQLLRSGRMESIGVLAGGIAHDLNNVLAPILMSIDILKQNTTGDERAHRMLEIVRASAQRGADLVRQVLTFSRGAKNECIAVSLRRLFDELENIVKETFPSNIRVVFNAAPRLWPVMGDASQLHQILLNLAVNARDAMPLGGTLTFNASNVTLKASPAGGGDELPAGSYLEIKVTDTGTGMTPEVRDRIFEPFFTTKDAGKGTGLGLASVYAIVKNSGGFIKVHSELGVGTTFRIHLPVDPTMHSDSRPPMLVEHQHGRGEMVLLIDDERSIRDIAQQTLETFGYRVLVAGDGIEGMALYARNAKNVAVVITDMMMPNCDGVSTIRALQGINPSARIIAASGLEINKGAVAGVSDFLTKPYTAETMLKLLRTVLDRP